MPPELRAIKDRWLGESSDEMTPVSAANDVDISTLAATSAPDRGDQQDQVTAWQNLE